MVENNAVLNTEKSLLRKQVKQERLSMSLDTIAASIHTHLENLAAFQKAVNITCYSALTHEVNLLALIQAHPEKNWLLPKILPDEQLAFYALPENLSLEQGKFGVLEPQPQVIDQPFPLDLLDLIIVPALMIDKNGFRLGHGRGYYDRLLVQVAPNVCTIAVVPAQHFVSSLPKESHDQPIKMVVTELGVENLP